MFFSAPKAMLWIVRRCCLQTTRSIADAVLFCFGPNRQEHGACLAFGVVENENVAHDGLVRHVGVVGMGVVDGIVLPFAHVRRKRLAVVVALVWFLRLAVEFHEILNERIGAGGCSTADPRAPGCPRPCRWENLRSS